MKYKELMQKLSTPNSAFKIFEKNYELDENDFFICQHCRKVIHHDNLEMVKLHLGLHLDEVLL